MTGHFYYSFISQEDSIMTKIGRKRMRRDKWRQISIIREIIRDNAREMESMRELIREAMRDNEKYSETIVREKR